MSIEWRPKLSNDFAVYKAKGVRIYYRKEYKLADILGLLKKVINYPENVQSHVLKRTWRSIVFLEEIPFGGIPKKIIVKYTFYNSSLFFSLRGLKFMLMKTFRGKTFLGGKGRRGWITGNGLIARGIPTPQPIALIERKLLGLVRNNILITEYIEGALVVNDYISKHFNKGLNLEMIKKKRLFIEALARLVRSFHDTGIYHADLSGRNILVKEGQQGNWEMFIIDLDAVSLWMRPTVRRRLKNLSQINDCPDCITNTDRMRFFRIYFRNLPLKAHEYIRKIVKLTRLRRLQMERRRFYMDSISWITADSRED